LSNSSLEKAVGRFIAENNLFDASQGILLAVSGGADSMALMAILSRLKMAGAIDVRLSVAHINHLLRGSDSDADEAFVIARAAEFGLPVKTRRVDLRRHSIENKISIETAARNLRIEMLCRIARENDCGCIATAHQKNDNAETVIHRLMRGTSFRGLAGIWPKKQFTNGIYFIRPLLEIERNDIENYLRANSLDWRLDKSNYDLSYTRNRIRHQLLSVMEKSGEKPLTDQLTKLAHNSYKLSGKVSNEIQRIWPSCAIGNADSGHVELDLKVLLSRPKLIQAELIRRALISIGSGERNLTAGHYYRVLSLAESGRTGRKIELPCRFIVRKEYRTIRFVNSEHQAIIQEDTLRVPGKTKFGNWLIEAKFLDAGQYDFEKFKAEKSRLIEWFDADRVALPLTIRPCRQDDRFGPLGMRNSKRVGKFLADAKINQSRINVIYSNEMIIWLCPVRIAEMAKVYESTSKILQLQAIKL